LWKNKHISHIEITAAESIGIENRGEYYDKAGAIRDMFQNHLLELLCLISMEIPKSNTSDMIRDEKLKVLKKIKKINTKTDIIRGQYIESEINGRKFSGYRKNKGVNKVSNTETFFACKLFFL
jgi:glucose-6-phosphate 1-dehydrogenase